MSLAPPIKAKSRLLRNDASVSSESSSAVLSAVDTKPIVHHRQISGHNLTERSGAQKFFQSRTRYLLLLFLGLSGVAGLVYILTTIPPSTVANIAFYQSYLPFLGVLYFTLFFLLNFIFLHTRRALLISLSITMLLFFKLQDFVITPLLILIVIGIPSSIELILSFIFKK